jgi:hypothetical protein
MSQDPIEAVTTQLEQIIEWSQENASRVGYFASLYLRVTTAARNKIGTGYFDNDQQMERLVATFAGRYLTALHQFQSQNPLLPTAWAAAFNAAKLDNLTIVQVLLVAMNPHINIDLGVACAQVAPGDSVKSLNADFLKVNAILASVLPTAMDEIDSLSPQLHLLHDLTGVEEDTLLDFSMGVARDCAWALANTLAYLSEGEQQKTVNEQDRIIAALGQRIISPDWVVAEIVDTVQQVECQDIRLIISALDSGNPLLDRQARDPIITEKETLHPNRVYYFEIGPGNWTGRFDFQITSWRKLWGSSMSVKNKFLASAMAIFHKVFGTATISSVITPYPDKGEAGSATNDIRIYKSWFQLWHSFEDYTLSPNGTAVRVDAHVEFGPLPFLFREHDVYPASVYEGGMMNYYHIKLLGTRFLGKYRVLPTRTEVQSQLVNDWSLATEHLYKVSATDKPRTE